ncbi:MAG: hypothetical protein M1820_007502 [Bogoriella megaspora]|nr:MAG: hypothetical protein M1820_007502 [Bogoriella megaspora]
MSSTSSKDRDPYFQRVHNLTHAYSALGDFLHTIENENDVSRRLVYEAHHDRYGTRPGRCVLLTFNQSDVTPKTFNQPKELDDYLSHFPPKDDRDPGRCRLWILEDMDPEWVAVLGRRLGVDPLVFSEQMNTWNFTNSKSIPARILPSLVDSTRSFTLRYYEFRQLQDPDSIDSMQNQMTFAINRRRYERWRDVDTPSFQNTWRHAFVRRCASFWTNQKEPKSGYDAIMLVDPAFDSFRWQDPLVKQIGNHIQFSSSSDGSRGCTILQDPRKYKDRRTLWSSRRWDRPDQVKLVSHMSQPYHAGPTTLWDASLAVGPDVSQEHILQNCEKRNLSSPLDEIVFHWTQLADQTMISSAREHSVNSAHFLLKYLATMWLNQLDLIECGVAQSQYFADDHQATIELDAGGKTWEKELRDIVEATRDMNYMKILMSHYQRAMTLNIENLGLLAGAEAVNEKAPQAIQDAQKDFIAIQSKFRPHRDQIDRLSGVANDIANLHTALRSSKDGELGLRLSLFASIVFPATLVTSLLSMGDDYLPGRANFWVFWAAAVPLVLLFAFPILYGHKVRNMLDQLIDLAKRKSGEKQKPQAKAREMNRGGSGQA